MAVYSDISLLNPTSKPLASDLEVIHQAIISLLNTRQGERLFRPEFGNRLEDLLFELIDDATALEVYRILTEDVARQIPLVEVNLQETRVVADPINLRYRLTLVVNVLGFSNRTLRFVGELSNNLRS